MPFARSSPLPSGAGPAAASYGWHRLLAGLGGRCEICRAWCAAGVCPACRHRFTPVQPRCRSCAIELPSSAPHAALCGACLQRPPPLSATVTGLRYAYPWDGLIQRFKGNGAVELARVLAEPLAQAVLQASRETVPRPWPHVLVPVPLARGRLRERGYNQAWELARVLSRRLGVPAKVDCLERVIDTPHQWALSRQDRQANVRGAFMPMAAATLLVGRHVAVVDDVMTTGATLREVAATLLRAGAADVQAWVVARTPLD